MKGVGSVNIDIISDIHVDSHIYFDAIQMNQFVKHLLKNKKSKILINAGDLSNSNRFSKMLLERLSPEYELIVNVFGNHDLYVSPAMLGRYPTMFSRWEELKDEVSHLKNVVFLEGDVIEYNGIKIGGTGAWYDWSYSIERLGLSIEATENVYKSFMNDSVYIPTAKNILWDLPYKEFQKLEAIADKVDIMVTHVAPKRDMIAKPYQKDLLSGGFSFKGDEVVAKTSAKIWIFGHTHSRQDFKEDGIRFINNAFGSMSESNDYTTLTGVKTIRI